MNNSRKVCDILLAMYRQIVALPNNRAANAVRYLVTVNSHKDATGYSRQSNKPRPAFMAHDIF
jgi:hypothetical protein